MPKTFLIILCSFLLSACASNEANKGPSLQERMQSAEQALKIVNPGQPDWCTAGTNCQLLGEIICNVNDRIDKKAEEICMKKLMTSAVTLGGDVIVLQARGLPDGQKYRDVSLFRAYGQVYKCSDANVALGQEIVKRYGATDTTNIAVYADEYFKQCQLEKQCKKVRPHNCSSSRDKGFELCVNKHEQNTNAGETSFNSLVINREIFNKMGIYRMFGTTYNCN